MKLRVHSQRVQTLEPHSRAIQMPFEVLVLPESSRVWNQPLFASFSLNFQSDTAPDIRLFVHAREVAALQVSAEECVFDCASLGNGHAIRILVQGVGHAHVALPDAGSAHNALKSDGWITPLSENPYCTPVHAWGKHDLGCLFEVSPHEPDVAKNS